MPEEINTQETLADGVDVASADGGRNDSDEVASLKDILGETLGRDFKDDETALKAVKDTFNYVGKVGKVLPVFEQLKSKFGSEDAVLKFMEQSQTTQNQQNPAVQTQNDAPELAKKVESLEQMLKETQFYAEKPEFKPYKDLIKSLGNDPEKVVESEVFKTTYSKVKSHDEAEKTKSVIHSNPRIGQATDKMSKASEAAKTGNFEESKRLAVDAVLDAFERN